MCASIKKFPWQLTLGMLRIRNIFAWSVPNPRLEDTFIE
jgi:hypothetical protein